jgi:hypothetical protein
MLNDRTSQYQVGRDYVIVSNARGNTDHRKQKYIKHDRVYLTLDGLSRVNNCSKLLNYGQSFGYIYLIRLENEHETIFKYGKTVNITSRFRTHRNHFITRGFATIELVKQVRVDIDKLTLSEASVKRYLDSNNLYHRADYSKELCKCRNGAEYAGLLQFYDTLEDLNYSDLEYQASTKPVKLLEYATDLCSKGQNAILTYDQLKIAYANALEEISSLKKQLAVCSL